MNNLNYSDVTLIPNRCIVSSRSQCDPSTVFLGRKFDLPVIPANMPSVVDDNIAAQCIRNNIPYIFPRYKPSWRGIDTIINLNALGGLVSISVGIKETDLALLRDAKSQNLNIDWITIDIAHGHNNDAVVFAKRIKDIYPESKIILGNLGSPRAIEQTTGYKEIDAIKVGIAKGGACSTYGATGFATPMFGLACEAGFGSTKPVIIDGGVKTSGDIVKALVAFYEGQNHFLSVDVDKSQLNCLVMAGGYFAACKDSPAKTFIIDGKPKKLYYGNASAENKSINNQSSGHVEGFSTYLDIDAHFVAKIQQTKENLQSAISYAGGQTLESLAFVEYLT